MNKAAKDVLAERRRQIKVEGWTLEHDDEHQDYELAIAASLYLDPFYGLDVRAGTGVTTPCWAPRTWPWDDKYWKPRTYRKNVVRACALALAEIERLDRMDGPTCPVCGYYCLGEEGIGCIDKPSGYGVVRRGPLLNEGLTRRNIKNDGTPSSRPAGAPPAPKSRSFSKADEILKAVRKIDRRPYLSEREALLSGYCHKLGRLVLGREGD